MTPQDFEVKLASEKFDPGVTVTKPAGYVMDEHTHPFEAWAFIIKGDITLQVNGVSTCYAAGDLFRLPAGTPHHESAVPNGVTYLAGRKHPSAT